MTVLTRSSAIEDVGGNGCLQKKDLATGLERLGASWKDFGAVQS